MENPGVFSQNTFIRETRIYRTATNTLFLTILDDTINTTTTIVTSQLPVSAWHSYIGDPTLADAILDRIVHSSHRMELKGATLRDNKQIKPMAKGDSDPAGVTA